MSDENPTIPSMQAAPAVSAPPANLTPTSMPAMTVEYRLQQAEQQIREIEKSRVTILADLRAEMASIRADYQTALATGIAEEAKKREALESRLTDLVKKVDDLTTEMSTQTTLLRDILGKVGEVATSVGGIISNPRVRNLAWALLVAVSAIASYYASELRQTPPAPAPAATVTVIVPPKEGPP